MSPTTRPRFSGTGVGDHPRIRHLTRVACETERLLSSTGVQILTNRPANGFGDADVFIGCPKQEGTFEFWVKADGLDRRSCRSHQWTAAPPAQNLASVIAMLGLVGHPLHQLVSDGSAVGRISVCGHLHPPFDNRDRYLALMAVACMTIGPREPSITTSSRNFPVRSGPSTRYRVGSSSTSSITIAFRSTCWMSFWSTPWRSVDRRTSLRESYYETVRSRSAGGASARPRRGHGTPVRTRRTGERAPRIRVGHHARLTVGRAHRHRGPGVPRGVDRDPLRPSHHVASRHRR